MAITHGRHTLVPEDVSCHIDLVFGHFCSIASGLTVVSGQHPGVDYRAAVSNFPFAEHEWGEYPPSRMEGRVEVCNDVWIGQNVTILDGLTIQSGAVIGAGAVVTRSVRPYATVVGNPARETGRRRFQDHQVQQLLQVGWWDWTDDEIKAALPLMAHVGNFLMKHGAR
jgi:acetyltransferase-like isoleucine patch superfamily enzyme